MSVFKKASELANEIREAKEYKTLIDCKCKMDNNEEASSLLRDMRILQEEYIKTLKENIDKDTINSLENILKNKHDELLANKLTHNYIIAKDVFDKLMKEINKVLAKGIALPTKDSGCENCEGCD